MGLTNIEYYIGANVNLTHDCNDAIDYNIKVVDENNEFSGGSFIPLTTGFYDIEMKTTLAASDWRLCGSWMLSFTENKKICGNISSGTHNNLSMEVGATNVVTVAHILPMQVFCNAGLVYYCRMLVSDDNDKELTAGNTNSFVKIIGIES